MALLCAVAKAEYQHSLEQASSNSRGAGGCGEERFGRLDILVKRLETRIILEISAGSSIPNRQLQ
jgi:hypothetical protein